MKHWFPKSWILLFLTGAFLASGCTEESSVTTPNDGLSETQKYYSYGPGPKPGNGNGNDNGGTNGNDNGGVNGNDNGGTNGNDNGGVNGNDNGGTNGNDNGGVNGNDNGGVNGNDNGGGGTCPDGSTQLSTQMTGGDSNEAEYRLFPNGCPRFRARVRDLAPNTVYNVVVAGVTVGTIHTDEDGRGELRYDGSLPPNFPQAQVGDRVTVGPVYGLFSSDCSSNSNCNG